MATHLYEASFFPFADVSEFVHGHDCAVVIDAEGTFMFAAPPHMAAFLCKMLNKHVDDNNMYDLVIEDEPVETDE